MWYYLSTDYRKAVMKVAILGCGPTGLLAAHACAIRGVSYDIFSKKRKSFLFGSQYLHESIRGLNFPEDGEPVKYITRGTPEEYRRKTHGKWWDGHVAPEEFEPDHTAWDIRQAYDRLWRFYSSDIQHYEIADPSEMDKGHHVADRVNYDLGLPSYDLVISTVPRSIWKVPGEEFIFSEGWALGDAPEQGQFVDFQCDDNTIICDGTEDVSWTRLSRVFGYTTVEWPHHAPKPPLPGVARVVKPLHYRPNSQMPNPTAGWLHVGRYGQFQKGIVVTDAFHDVINKLKEMQ